MRISKNEDSEMKGSKPGERASLLMVSLIWVVGMVTIFYGLPAFSQELPFSRVVYSGEDSYGSLSIVERSDEDGNVLRRTMTFVSASSATAATLVWDEKRGTDNVGTLMAPGGELTVHFDSGQNTLSMTVSPNTGLGWLGLYSAADGSLLSSQGDLQTASAGLVGPSPDLWADFSDFLKTEGIQKEAANDGEPGPLAWAGHLCMVATARTIMAVSVMMSDTEGCLGGVEMLCNKLVTFDVYTVLSAYESELYVCATTGS